MLCNMDNEIKNEKESSESKVVTYIMSKLSKLNNFVTLKSIEKKQKEMPQKVVSCIKYKPLRSKVPFVESINNDMQIFSFNSDKKKTIVYLHGGAFVNEPVPQHFSLVEKICLNTDYGCNLVIYPLVPFSNAEKCVKQVADYVLSLNKNVVLAGDSAGGGLVLSVNYYLEKMGHKVVDKIVAISPWLDVSLQNKDIEFYAPRDKVLDREYLATVGKMWADNIDVSDPLCSPINIDKLDVKTLLISGTSEILTADINDFYEKFKSENVTWFLHEKMQHDFVLYPIREAKEAQKQIFDFLNAD